MLTMPVLETPRLFIRPFTLDDLDAIYQILDVELSDLGSAAGGGLSYQNRREWLDWSARNYEQLARLYQPPYGDRAVVLKTSGLLVGAAGYSPTMAPFAQLPYYGGKPQGALSTFEFGLYYAISPAYQRQGIATEAAQALIDFAFNDLHLKRIIATTHSDNLASQGVMRRLGMRLEHNPFPEPAWFQVVGIIEK
jgi:[ribosomal protein S5]-alanine N-acetyltransferase